MHRTVCLHWMAMYSVCLIVGDVLVTSSYEKEYIEKQLQKNGTMTTIL